MSKKYNFMTWNDIEKVAAEQEAKLAKLVDWTGEDLVLDGHYVIERDRIDDYPSLVNWLEHLTEKNWVTSEMVNEIIRLWRKKTNNKKPL